MASVDVTDARCASSKGVRKALSDERQQSQQSPSRINASATGVYGVSHRFPLYRAFSDSAAIAAAPRGHFCHLLQVVRNWASPYWPAGERSERAPTLDHPAECLAKDETWRENQPEEPRCISTGLGAPSVGRRGCKLGEIKMATLSGIYRASVIDNNDPAAQKRLQISVLGTPGASSWATPCAPYGPKPNTRVTKGKLSRCHFAVGAKGGMKPLKTSLRHRRTARIRGDFVAPQRNAKSPTMSREHRESSESVHKASTNKDFRYFALGSTTVGFRPGRRS
jgi:hypothetical protein